LLAFSCTFLELSRTGIPIMSSPHFLSNFQSTSKLFWKTKPFIQLHSFFIFITLFGIWFHPTFFLLVLPTKHGFKVLRERGRSKGFLKKAKRSGSGGVEKCFFERTGGVEREERGSFGVGQGCERGFCSSSLGGRVLILWWGLGWRIDIFWGMKVGLGRFWSASSHLEEVAAAVFVVVWWGG